MRARKRLVFGIVFVLAFGAAVALFQPRVDHRPQLALLSAPDSAIPARIVVGEAVQTSMSRAEIDHEESVVASDPTDPSRLIVAAMIRPPDSKLTKVVGYYSHDGGSTWHLSFDRRGQPEEEFLDPTTAFGPDGSLWSASEAVIDPGKHPFGDSNGRVEFFRSRDGGMTWERRASIKQYLDRPWIAVDGSARPDRGRLYCFANVYQPILFTSGDQGESFTPPLSWPVDLKTKYLSFKPGNPVVLSDGTLVLHYDLRLRDQDERPVIPVLISQDGGRSFSQATPVNTAWRHERVKTSNFNIVPQMAADTLSRAFRDRLYCVWEDGSGFSQVRILFSSSADQGTTWSPPLVLSEQPAGPTAGGDYASIMPSVAVNPEGVIAVTWYDRRGLAKGDELDDKEPGFDVRMRASLDGGATWLASVKLNGKTIGLRTNRLGHTSGLAAGAGGDFFPAWIDDRTGKSQVWVARVKVLRFP